MCLFVSALEITVPLLEISWRDCVVEGSFSSARRDLDLGTPKSQRTQGYTEGFIHPSHCSAVVVGMFRLRVRIASRFSCFAQHDSLFGRVWMCLDTILGPG